MCVFEQNSLDLMIYISHTHTHTHRCDSSFLFSTCSSPGQDGGGGVGGGAFVKAERQSGGWGLGQSEAAVGVCQHLQTTSAPHFCQLQDDIGARTEGASPPPPSQSLSSHPFHSVLDCLSSLPLTPVGLRWRGKEGGCLQPAFPSCF